MQPSLLGKRALSSPPPNERLPPKPPSETAQVSRLAHPLLDTRESPFKANPPFQQPCPIATFSFDETRTIHHDDRSRMYYRRPPPRADLNYGFDRFTQRDESVPEHLDALLECLFHDPEIEPERKRAELVTWRGIMTKLCTAFDQYSTGGKPSGDAFELNAMMVGRTLYLEEHISPSRKQEKAKQDSNERLKRFGYYGYSFESYCTVDTKDQLDQPPVPRGGPPGWSGDVNTNVQWCQAVKTKLGSSRLILGGEVDCVDAHHRPVELKTSINIRPGPGSTDTLRFERKLLKFYMQSFLLGIPRIVVAFRDTRGLIVTHQEFETLAIPRMVRAGSIVGVDHEGRQIRREKSLWEPKDSLGFGDRIVEWMKKTVEAEMGSDDPPPVDEAVRRYPVFRVSFLHPFEEVTLRRLDEEEVEQVKDHGLSGERVGFLSKRYYDTVTQQ